MVYDTVSRHSHIVDWSFRASDRGVPRDRIVYLVTLWNRLEEAVYLIENSEYSEDINDATYKIDTVKIDLGIPVIGTLVHRSDAREAYDAIYYELTGTQEEYYVIQELPVPKIITKD